MMTMRMNQLRAAVCAFLANNLHQRGKQGSWKPTQQSWKNKEKKELRRVDNLPPSFG